MSDEELPAEPATSIVQILEQALEGGILRLAVGKPVQQAIGRLVSGVVDVPVSYLESWAQRVRSDITARSRVMSAIAGSAKALVVADRELAQRGLDRWAGKLAARQASIDNVAIRTLGALADAEIPLGSAAPPEDFMRMFEDIAERASSESVADLLSRILAGEIRRPRSVSLRTLQIVSIVDREIIEAFQTLAPYWMDGGWLAAIGDKRRDWGSRLALLANVSILENSPIGRLELNKAGQAFIRQGSRGILLTAPRAQKFGLIYNQVVLTPIGSEIRSLFPWNAEPRLEEIGRDWMTIDQVDKAEICDATQMDGRFVISKLFEPRQSLT